MPPIGGNWGQCDPANPKNRRRRCSMLVERIDGEGTTRVLIDTTPDLREQLLSAGVGTLDGVVFTHAHADHTHGIDDLRMVVANMRARLNIWADQPTRADLMLRFSYAFEQPDGSLYPPILHMNHIEGPIKVSGAGGTITFDPFEVNHGLMDALGFRIGPLAYLPDVKTMNDEAWDKLQNLECWVLDALRRDVHPTHVHLDEALAWIAQAAPKRAVLTNMHIDFDYEALKAETPDTVEPAFDGMTMSFEV